MVEQMVHNCDNICISLMVSRQAPGHGNSSGLFYAHTGKGSHVAMWFCWCWFYFLNSSGIGMAGSGKI